VIIFTPTTQAIVPFLRGKESASQENVSSNDVSSNEVVTANVVTANVVNSSLILITLITEEIISSEMSVVASATRRHIREDSIHIYHRR
jgi:hypothetical protein